MRVKAIFYIILLFVVTAAQISFISGLPAWPAHLNIILVFLIALLLFGKNELLWPMAISAGLLLDSVSFYPFGTHLISICLTVAASGYLFERFFTHRSVYTFFALAFIATLVYSFFFTAVSCLLIFLNPDALSVPVYRFFWLRTAKAALLNGLALSLIFYCSALFGRGKPSIFFKRSLRF